MFVCDNRSHGERDRPPLDALHPDVELPRQRRPDHRPRRGRLRLGLARPSLPRRPRRAVRGQRRPRPHRDRRGRRQAGRRARVLPPLVVRPPDGDRARRPDRRAGARRPQPDLLHHRRLRGRRVRVEARPRLLQADRQAQQAQGRQPLHRLPRHLDGRAVDHRPARHQERLRAARARRDQGAEHQLLPGAGARRLAGGLRAVGGRGDRPGHRARRAGHRRGRLPRAGAELRRLLPAAARLLPAGPGDLRRVRRPARLRRGDLRVGPARRILRRREVRLPARHHHHREGPHLRLRPAGRDDRRATG